MPLRLTFHDGEPVPESYLERLRPLFAAAIEAEELYGSEEERIVRPEDWPVDGAAD